MINLHFDGYWINQNCSPSYGGIYIVSALRIINKTIVNAENIHKRHVEDGPHEHYGDFLKKLYVGEQIGYTCAPVEVVHLIR